MAPHKMDLERRRWYSGAYDREVRMRLAFKEGILFRAKTHPDYFEDDVPLVNQPGFEKKGFKKVKVSRGAQDAFAMIFQDLHIRPRHYEALRNTILEYWEMPPTKY